VGVSGSAASAGLLFLCFAEFLAVKRLLTLGAIILVGGIIFWGLFGFTNTTWHQRLTLIVDTPTGQVQGAAVIEVRNSEIHNPTANFGTGASSEITGEATVVEVLPGRYLFALLDGSAGRFATAIQQQDGWISTGEMFGTVQNQTEPVTLTGDLIPMLVTFDDITDPTTVRQVDPTNLAATFGPGVSLAAVTLEITEEDVTQGRILTWLGQFPETPLRADIDPMDFSFEAQLLQGSFIRR
jgi:hypothetical protein